MRLQALVVGYAPSLTASSHPTRLTATRGLKQLGGTMKTRSLLAVAGLTMAASLAGAGAAAADPTKAQTLTLVCDNGSTYTVVVNSNGAWSPAHDVKAPRR